MSITLEREACSIVVYSEASPTEEPHQNVDIEVQLSDGTRYAATLFTLDSIATLMKAHEVTGENGGGRYFWSTGAIVVRDLSLESIAECVEIMIKEGDLHQAFEQL